MYPTSITFTGADERTRIRDLLGLLADDAVELGFLVTAMPEGRNRYPSMRWLAKAAASATGRCALHVCGQHARGMLLEGKLDPLLAHARRIQVNGRIGQPAFDAQLIESVCVRYPAHAVITQQCAGNEPLLRVAPGNHALLVDGSGGRGQSPDQWARPTTKKAVGFAGGLGPANLAQELPRIARAADGRAFWVDMEGMLRDADDWFQVARAQDALQQFRAVVGPAQQSAFA